MTQDSGDREKLRKAVRILERKLGVIALHLKALAARGFQSGSKGKTDNGGSYWHPTEQSQRYPIRSDEDPGEAGEQAVQRRIENNSDKASGKDRKGRTKPVQIDINAFEFYHEKPEEGAELDKYLDDYWTGDPRYYLMSIVNLIAGEPGIPNDRGILKAAETIRNALIESPKFKKHKLSAVGRGGIETKERMNQKAKDKLVREFQEYARRIEPKAMALLDEYNRQLRITHERTDTIYRAMNDKMFRDFMKYGLRPNPGRRNGEGGVIYCTVSRDAALRFKNYDIVVQFKDANKESFPLEYIPLSYLKVGKDKVFETSKYGSIEYVNEHECWLPDDHNAKSGVVFIKLTGTRKEAIDYVRGWGWTGKIVIIHGMRRPKK